MTVVNPVKGVPESATTLRPSPSGSLSLSSTLIVPGVSCVVSSASGALTGVSFTGAMV